VEEDASRGGALVRSVEFMVVSEHELHAMQHTDMPAAGLLVH